MSLLRNYSFYGYEKPGEKMCGPQSLSSSSSSVGSSVVLKSSFGVLLHLLPAAPAHPQLSSLDTSPSRSLNAHSLIHTGSDSEASKVAAKMMRSARGIANNGNTEGGASDTKVRDGLDGTAAASGVSPDVAIHYVMSSSSSAWEDSSYSEEESAHETDEEGIDNHKENKESDDDEVISGPKAPASPESSGAPSKVQDLPVHGRVLRLVDSYRHSLALAEVLVPNVAKTTTTTFSSSSSQLQTHQGTEEKEKRSPSGSFPSGAPPQNAPSTDPTRVVSPAYQTVTVLGYDTRCQVFLLPQAQEEQRFPGNAHGNMRKGDGQEEGEERISSILESSLSYSVDSVLVLRDMEFFRKAYVEAPVVVSARGSSRDRLGGAGQEESEPHVCLPVLPPAPPHTVLLHADYNAKCCFFSPPLDPNLLWPVFRVRTGTTYWLRSWDCSVRFCGVACGVPWITRVKGVGRTSAAAAVSVATDSESMWCEPLPSCLSERALMELYGICDPRVGAAAATDGDHADDDYAPRVYVTSRGSSSARRSSLTSTPPRVSPPEVDALLPFSAGATLPPPPPNSSMPYFVRGRKVLVPGSFGVLLECDVSRAALCDKFGVAHADRLVGRDLLAASGSALLSSSVSSSAAAGTGVSYEGQSALVMGASTGNLVLLFEGAQKGTVIRNVGSPADVARLFRKVSGAPLPPPGLPVEGEAEETRVETRSSLQKMEEVKSEENARADEGCEAGASTPAIVGAEKRVAFSLPINIEGGDMYPEEEPLTQRQEQRIVWEEESNETSSSVAPVAAAAPTDSATPSVLPSSMSSGRLISSIGVCIDYNKDPSVAPTSFGNSPECAQIDCTTTATTTTMHAEKDKCLSHDRNESEEEASAVDKERAAAAATSAIAILPRNGWDDDDDDDDDDSGDEKDREKMPASNDWMPSGAAAAAGPSTSPSVESPFYVTDHQPPYQSAPTQTYRDTESKHDDETAELPRRYYVDANTGLLPRHGPAAVVQSTQTTRAMSFEASTAMSDYLEDASTSPPFSSLPSSPQFTPFINFLKAYALYQQRDMLEGSQTEVTLALMQDYYKASPLYRLPRARRALVRCGQLWNRTSDSDKRAFSTLCVDEVVDFLSKYEHEVFGKN